MSLSCCTFLSLMPSCRTRVEWVIFVLFRFYIAKKNHTMDPCIGSSSFLQHNSSSFYNSFCRCCVEICKGKMYIIYCVYFFSRAVQNLNLKGALRSTHHILTFTNVSNLSKQILPNPKGAFNNYVDKRSWVGGQ